MGTDLKLIPFGGNGVHSEFANEVLVISRNDELYERVRALPALPVPTPFDTYLATLPKEENGFGDTQIDKYGEPLMATTAKLLKTCQIPGPQGAYITACRDDQRIALFWC